eukprot:403331965
MYKINELLDMSICKEETMLYNIELSATSPILDQLKNNEENIDVNPKIQTYTITKHLQEIKFFLKFVVRKFKVHQHISGHDSIQVEGNKQFLVNLFKKETTQFLMEIHQDEAKKCKTNLNNMKMGLTHAIQLLNALNIEVLWMDDITINFFEVSFFNFQKPGAWQTVLKQGFILKQAGGRPSSSKCCSNKCLTPMRYSRKWFILTNQFLCYVERPFPKSFSEQGINNLQQNILLNVSMSQQQSINNNITSNMSGLPRPLASNNLNNSIKIENNKNVLSQLILSLKFIEKELLSWRHKLLKGIDHSPWSNKLDRFVQDSFAPLRKGNKVRIMIDGEMYFRNMAEQIRKAESEIFITDWWMVAKYYLERPVKLSDEVDSQTGRLDLLLLAAAERGVKIFILHWRESKFAVEFNSLLTKQYLMSLHPNIKMLRHSQGAIQLWSHHAKLCIIDQQFAFIGGLDICFGRWDTRNHPLYDIGFNEEDQCLFPGKDYANERNVPIKNPEDIMQSVLNRDGDARMPFHDTGVFIEGDTANDLSHHFVQLWNNAKLNKHGPQISTMQVITTRGQKVFRDQFKYNESIFDKMLRSLRKGRGNSVMTPVQDAALTLEESKNRERMNSVSKFDEEDDKFDEEFDEIIAKNMNFNQFNLMQDRMKTPASLQNLNRRYISKIQNIFSILKQGRNKKINQNSMASTPMNNHKISDFTNELQDIQINKTEEKLPPSKGKQSLLKLFQADFFKPDSKKIQMSQGIPKSQFDEENDGQFEHKDTTRLENGGGLFHGHDQSQDSGIIMKRNNISIEKNPIFMNNCSQNQQNFENIKYEMQSVSEIEVTNHNLKALIEIDEEDIQLRQKVSAEKTSPFINSEEVQILMQSPNRFETQVKEKPPLGDFEESPDFDKELSTMKRNLIQTFHSYGNIKDDLVDKVQHQNCTIQALRSASPWSLGLLKVEHSIYEAYIQLIEQSKHFIYIENQFFISQCVLHEANKTSIVKNKIGLALRERILRAHKNQKEFLVIIFIPLMPAFPGDILDSSSSILRLQMNYQMNTMARGKTSLIELLKSDGIEDPWHYVRFFSLRTHSIMPKTGLPVTEQIYIHSKCMIVDDTHVIIGSANINDRSMLGSRDHETGVVISQTNPEDQKESFMNGKKVQVGKMAHQFRTELMMEHFGFDYKVVQDPLLNRQRLFDQAQTNSKAFFDIFRCEPDNSISSFVELQTIRSLRKEDQQDKEGFIEKYERIKPQIFGNAVIYPNDFMKDEQLGINFLNSEILVPEIVFV